MPGGGWRIAWGAIRLGYRLEGDARGWLANRPGGDSLGYRRARYPGSVRSGLWVGRSATCLWVGRSRRCAPRGPVAAALTAGWLGWGRGRTTWPPGKHRIRSADLQSVTNPKSPGRVCHDCHAWRGYGDKSQRPRRVCHVIQARRGMTRAVREPSVLRPQPSPRVAIGPVRSVARCRSRRSGVLTSPTGSGRGAGGARPAREFAPGAAQPAREFAPGRVELNPPGVRLHPGVRPRARLNPPGTSPPGGLSSTPRGFASTREFAPRAG
jgi:hypothetical protein